MTRINIKKEFGLCVKSLGGDLLDEVLVNPGFSNADYWFPQDCVVGELKCLDEDLREKDNFNRQIEHLYLSWVQRDLMPPLLGRRAFNLRAIPETCAREYMEIVKKRLEFATIKKANKQIRETKKHFGVASAKGILILVNDGNLMLKPDMMEHLLSRILNGKYSSINSVIYLSVNYAVSAPGVNIPTLFWFDAKVGGREPVTLPFRAKLREAWLHHHSLLIKEPLIKIAMPNDPAIVEQIDFYR